MPVLVTRAGPKELRYFYPDWDEEEIELLRFLIEDLNLAYWLVAKLLPPRTEFAVVGKAARLKIKHDMKRPVFGQYLRNKCSNRNEAPIDYIAFVKDMDARRNAMTS